LLSYFKLNDPFRLVPLFVLVFLLKLPTFLSPVAYPDVYHWFTIGEAMQANNSMYIDIWDGLAPFSATIYMVITWLFARSILSLMLLGALLTFFQAIIINNFSIQAKLFENNTYLPSLVYILITSSHPAFFTLSPSLMGLTFILLGLGKLLSHVEFRAKQDLHIILIGLYFGFAPLFYLPFVIIIPIGLVLLALFSNTVLRRYLLLIITSITPLIIAFFYYWLINDHPVYFIRNFLLIGYYDSYYLPVTWANGSIILGFGAFFMIIGVLSFGKQRRLTNYQYRIAQLFFVLGALLLFILLLEKPTTQYSLVIFIPVIVIFIVHLISLVRNIFFSSLLASLLFLGPPLLLWLISHQYITDTSTTPDTPKIANYKTIVKNKNIMVLGSAKDLYNEARLAGPFYDWGLSKSFFYKLDYYDNLVFLKAHFDKSRPEIIIDLENNWPSISKRLPSISKQYHQIKPNVWVLIK